MISAQPRPPTAQPQPQPRLRLEPTASRKTVLDGGWWPRSTDASAELPPLIEALKSRSGSITHVLFNASDWDLPHPRRVTVGDRAVRLGWFTAQPAGLLTLICDFGRDRIDLLVVPIWATSASACAAMATAADARNRSPVPNLLATIDRSA